MRKIDYITLGMILLAIGEVLSLIVKSTIPDTFVFTQIIGAFVIYMLSALAMGKCSKFIVDTWTKENKKEGECK